MRRHCRSPQKAKEHFPLRALRIQGGMPQRDMIFIFKIGTTQKKRGRFFKATALLLFM
jgi:hypothetical protein